MGRSARAQGVSSKNPIHRRPSGVWHQAPGLRALVRRESAPGPGSWTVARTLTTPRPEVLVVSIVPWVLGAAGLAAGPALVGLAERTTRSSRTSSGRVRTVVVGAVAVVTASLWWVGWCRFGTTLAWLAWCWVCALGCSLVVTDLRWRRLPFALVTALAGGDLAVWLAAAVVEGLWTRLGFACTAAVAVFAVAMLVQLWVPEHTGGGDSALYGAIALHLGWFGWDGLLRGLLTASAVTAAVALVVAARFRSMNSRFPAGPPLLAGALLSTLIA